MSSNRMPAAHITTQYLQNMDQYTRRYLLTEINIIALSL